MTIIDTILRSLSPRPSTQAIIDAAARCRVEGCTFEEIKSAFRRHLTHKKRSTVDDMVNHGWADAEPKVAVAA